MPQMRGHVNVATHLLTSGSVADTEDYTARTSFIHAVVRGHTPVVQLLIAHGASIRLKQCDANQERETLVILAGRGDHMKTFQTLIEAGVPVNVCSDLDGETPLISAARWDYFSGVQLLIAHAGGSLGHREKRQKTSVHLSPARRRSCNPCAARPLSLNPCAIDS